MQSSGRTLQFLLGRESTFDQEIPPLPNAPLRTEVPGSSYAMVQHLRCSIFFGTQPLVGCGVMRKASEPKEKPPNNAERR